MAGVGGWCRWDEPGVGCPGVMLSNPAVSAGKVELHGKVMEVDYSVPKKLR